MTINQPIVYKVAISLHETEDDCRYYSSYVPKHAKLEYKIGTWTNKPINGGPIFVFSTLDAAQHYIDFSSRTRKYVILECFALGVSNKIKVYEKPLVERYATSNVITSFADYYPNLFANNNRSWIIPTNKTHLPTMLVCFAVKPIKIVL